MSSGKILTVTEAAERRPQNGAAAAPSGSTTVENGPAVLDKTYQPGPIEAHRYALWEASGAFAADPDSDKRPYAIMMPPPNVTGSLHIGHALTFTLQDVLVRYQRMRGRDVLWQPGTDHAGIATEIVVGNQLAASGQVKTDIGREEFVARVWQWKEQSGGTITRQLRRLGASADWRRERFTMDPGLAAAVRRVFVQLYREGLIYRDQRLVNWDPVMHTVISDLEVDSRETKGSLWHIRYPVGGSPGRFIVVATTRPETMLGDTGVAVHPDDARYADLVGKSVHLPLTDRIIPIVADEHADPETGSGAVKVTPAHDFNDFEVGRRHGLATLNIFDRDARLTDAVPEPYRGLDRFEARRRVVQDLAAADLLEKIEDHVLMVPHHDRSGVVIEPWLTDQWYCDAGVLAKPALAAVEEGRTCFVPRQWENTFFDWMRKIQPWCISRQLWWGHRIPAWYAPDGTVFVAESAEKARQQAAEKYGEPVELWQDEDVLDTWFSSALWPFSTLGWPEATPELERYYPTDVLVTGFDIIFFWVARMMMMALHFMNDVPFRTVYIHALVRDAQGQKMSKSRGNIIDPLELIERYGCDALRFTLAALAAPGRDIKLSENRVEGYRNFATKLWNAVRYAQLSGCAVDADFAPGASRLTVNRWIIGATVECAADVTTALDAYRFDEAASRLYHFVWGSFCDWYIEFTKPILQGEDAAARAETQATTAWVIGQIVHLLHPVMPFITEELWDRLTDGAAGMLITAAWPEFGRQAIDPASAEMEWVVQAISAIRTLRAEMNVPAAARVPLLIRDADPLARERIERHREHFVRLARVERFEPVTEIPAGGVQVVVEGATLVLRLGEVVDLGRERERLNKEIGKLDAELGKIAAKLGNPNFLTKAKAEVIEEQRERQADAARDRDRLKAAYERLVGSEAQPA
jgi:valyl-tRNA synthetase